MSDEPLNTFDRDESDSYCPVEAKPENKQPLPVYHGQLTDAVAKLGSAELTASGKHGEDAIATVGGVIFLIASYYKDDKMSLGINDHKLLTYAVSKFTESNAHSNKDGGMANRRVNIPVKDFARALGYAVDPADDSPKAKARAKTVLDNVRKSAMETARTLSRLQAKEMSGTDDGSTNVLYTNIFESFGVIAGSIAIDFSPKVATYLLTRPIMQFPQTMFAIPGKYHTAYRIGFQMARHASMDGNVRKGTANRLKVETLLKDTDLPTIDYVRGHNQSWSALIKTPFLKAMFRLQNINGVLSTWGFVGEKGRKLTDAELKASMSTYSTFANLYVEYELTDPADQSARLARRAEEYKKRQESAKKRAKGRKR